MGFNHIFIKCDRPNKEEKKQRIHQEKQETPNEARGWDTPTNSTETLGIFGDGNAKLKVMYTSADELPEYGKGLEFKDHIREST